MNTFSKALLDTLLLAAAGIGIFYIIFFLIRLWTKRKKNFIPKLFDQHIHLAGLILFLAIICNVALLNFKPFILSNAYSAIEHTVGIILILAIGFFIFKVVAFAMALLIGFYQRKKYKDYTLRSVRTKFQLIQRILNLVITIIVIGAVLLTFEQVRKVGTTILASAGVASIFIGFAAQKSLGSLFAGIQIAITQPIKLDDTIVVDDHFGTVGDGQSQLIRMETSVFHLTARE